jgi:hypothetical protein
MMDGDHVVVTTTHRNDVDSPWPSRGSVIFAGRRGVIRTNFARGNQILVDFPEDKEGNTIWASAVCEWIPIYKLRPVSPLILLAECAE